MSRFGQGEIGRGQRLSRAWPEDRRAARAPHSPCLLLYQVAFGRRLDTGLEKGGVTAGSVRLPLVKSARYRNVLVNTNDRIAGRLAERYAVVIGTGG
jgi:hypothetical protein